MAGPTKSAHTHISSQSSGPDFLAELERVQPGALAALGNTTCDMQNANGVSIVAILEEVINPR